MVTQCFYLSLKEYHIYINNACHCLKAFLVIYLKKVNDACNLLLKHVVIVYKSLQLVKQQNKLQILKLKYYVP
jgi:hypothetical protein